ncbi:hypothetical protein ACFWWB_27040 [Streptomyces sp. NPDC058690]|uniref:hypothetical protein n=1 Tax=Streptomyces sp. NPDC058690 TaxID=3346600 RepID=UPI00365EACFE
MTARRLLARLGPVLVVAALTFSPAVVTAEAVPSSAAVGAVHAPNQGGYQDGYRTGYRAGFRDGYGDARDDCRAKRGQQGYGQYLRTTPSLYTQGYAVGYGSGYSSGFGRAENRYC